MSARILLLFALLVAVAVPPAGADEINPVVAKAGDFIIRETDLDRIIAAQPPQTQQQLQAKPELKINLVKEIILNRAVATRARKEGFDRKPEFREKLAYVIDSFLSNEYLNKTVAVADIRVSDEELHQYYKKHEKEFRVEATVKARHIFFKIPATASEAERKQSRAKAAAALDRLQKGDDFAKVAAELSEDADSAKSGGELGIIAAGKTNSTEFETAAFALKKGETSDIVTTPFGLHIIRIDDRTEQRTATFAEMRDYIEAQLKNDLGLQKTDAFIADILKESDVQIFTERLGGSGDNNDKKPEK